MFALYNEMVIKEKERLSLCCTVPMMFVFFFSFHEIFLTGGRSFAGTCLRKRFKRPASLSLHHSENPIP
ncbi:hypothetical protein B4135_0788 [Caldibacillus debilis]|uniref:Uncharacterized protein n=1 Tax=Caldibacillus debilis TaxID=301148 RepID=A0A150M706_9BACI|nr:hypothetical protein B4135_0788 [Caldibacillus debilis]